MPTAGSYFSGIGGLDLGMDLAGWDVKWQVENDPFCIEILKRRWPDTKRYQDVRRKFIPESVDLLFGGFPCQPSSTAGLQLGTKDPRWLWPHFLNGINQLRPKWVLIENVQGLRTKGLGTVLQGLADCGYDAEWDCIPAASFGAPHLRYRIFIVAYPCGNWNGERFFAAKSGSEGLNAHIGNGGTRPKEEDGKEANKSPLGSKTPSGSNGVGLLRTRVSENGRRQDGTAVLQSAGDRRSGKGTGRVEGSSIGTYPNSARLQRLRDQRKLRQVEEEVSVGRYGWWQSEPDVGRVAYGIPDRVDRLRSLGNAVVPQVAYWLGKRLLEAHANLY